MYKHLISLLFAVMGYCGYSQFTLSGTIVDAEQKPVSEAIVQLGQHQTSSSSEGFFTISGLSKGNFTLSVTHINYQEYLRIIELKSNLHIKIQLLPKLNLLEEVAVNSTSQTIENTEKISNASITTNFSGSLASSLENTAGVNAFRIGSGAAKPIIRGLGHNRVAVAVNGIKHQGQPWGSDHGLEIDAFSTEEVEVIKGASSIRYGSNAIGGALVIKNHSVPQKDSIQGNITLLGRSVNQTIGAAFDLKERKNKLFYKLSASYLDYGDLKTTTDTIVYLTRNIPIHNRKLKNTAGMEWNAMGQIGYMGENYQSTFLLSNNRTKAGFFPGAHGVPELNRLQDDKNSRNINYPYQQVNHLTVQNSHQWNFSENKVSIALGYQNNRRQEMSEFHTHYANQNTPESLSDVELDFNLTTWSADATLLLHHSSFSQTELGLQSHYQQNTIKGYSFLLPEYKQFAIGMFALHHYKLSNQIKFNLGVRYDYASISLSGFYDTILYDYLTSQNYSQEIANQYALRSPELSKNFSNLNGKMGLLYTPDEKWSVALNLGSSFRTPTAIELGANGIHHGSFRHEKGDSSLNSEKGYTADLQIGFSSDKFRIGVNPYLYYFSNFIYLKPSGAFSILPHAGQIYQYTQTRALLSGGEVESEITWNRFQTTIIAEYIYNIQLKDNYPLLFTPPFNLYTKVNYTLIRDSKHLKNTEIYFSGKYFATQNRIAQNEEITPESFVMDLGFSTTLKFGKTTPKLVLSVQNLWDTRYYSHTSFYRALEIPEQGRNVQVMLQIPF